MDIPAERRKARWRKRRLIFNDDGTQSRTLSGKEVKERFYYPVNPNTCEHTHENFLNMRMRPLLGSQVDTLVYCTGVFNHYHHHGEETELLKFAGNNSPDWAWELGAKGDDTLATVVKFCRTNSLEVFWSFRMNDSHDSYLPTLRSKWKDEHPELLMGKTKGSSRWSLLDYEKPAVREKVLAILEDVLARYDVDGIELDFFRHPAFLRHI